MKRYILQLSFVALVMDILACGQEPLNITGITQTETQAIEQQTSGDIDRRPFNLPSCDDGQSVPCVDEIETALPEIVSQRVTLLRTRFFTGDGIPALAHVAIPRKPAPKGGWPIVSLNHGLTGFAAECGSVSRTPDKQPSSAAMWAASQEAVVVATDPVGIGDEVIANSGHRFHFGVAANGEVILDGIQWLFELQRRGLLEVSSRDVRIVGNCVGTVNTLWALSRYQQDYNNYRSRDVFNFSRTVLGSPWSMTHYSQIKLRAFWNTSVDDPALGATMTNMLAFSESIQTTSDFIADDQTLFVDMETRNFIRRLNTQYCSESSEFRLRILSYGAHRGWWCNDMASCAPTLGDVVKAYYRPEMAKQMQSVAEGNPPNPLLTMLYAERDGWSLPLPKANELSTLR